MLNILQKYIFLKLIAGIVSGSIGETIYLSVPPLETECWTNSGLCIFIFRFSIHVHISSSLYLPVCVSHIISALQPCSPGGG
jgi:hypothetical protein